MNIYQDGFYITPSGIKYEDLKEEDIVFLSNEKEYDFLGIIFVVPIFFIGYFIHHLFWFDIHESYLLIMIMFAIMNVTVKAPEFITKRLVEIQKFIKTVFGSIIYRNSRFVSVSIIISIFLIFINVEMKMYQQASDIWNYAQINISEIKQEGKEEGYVQSKVKQILKAINRFSPMSNQARTFLLNDSIGLIPKLKEPSKSQLLNIAFAEGYHAIDKNPNYWKLHARLGVLYFEAAKYSDNEENIVKYIINAEKLFKDSINLGPSRADVYKMLLNLYLFNDEFEKATMIVEQYKNFLNSINVELDSNYYQMNQLYPLKFYY